MATKKKEKKKDKAPKGLAISRSGLNFTLTWTPVKGAKKQELKFYVKTAKGTSADNKKKKGWKLTWGGGKNDTIKANAKSKKCSVDGDNYYPKKSGGKTVYSVVFVLRSCTTSGSGKNKKTKWSKEIIKEYVIQKPGKPSYIAPQEYSGQAYTYTYSWGRNAQDDRKPKVHFTSYEWQSVLTVSNVASGDKLKSWKPYSTQKITTLNTSTGQTKTNQPSYGSGSSITIVDAPSVVTKDQRRFIRVRARGIAGNSEWTYIDHSFAKPEPTTIESASITSRTSLGFTGSIKFKAPVNNGHPVDNVEVNYAIVNPRTATSIVEEEDALTKEKIKWVTSTVTVPTGFASWNTYREIGATGKDATMSFQIDEPITDNQVLFMRVNSIHASEITLGTPYLVFPQDGKGFLTDPVLNNIRVNPAGNAVELEVLNESELENNKSFVAVYFRTDSNQNPENPIGIIPYGAAQPVTFKIPEFEASERVSFGIQTLVADYTPTEYSGELTYYTIRNIKMASPSIRWDNNAIPLPPSKPILTRVKEGVIQVNWDWPWAEANSAELSWSDDPDAWMSTNGPSTYTVENLYSGQWNISGLSAGTWYVKVRLIRNTENGTVFGTYSEVSELNISSAPNTPTLTLEPVVVPVDGEVNAYWLYSSTDGTGQKQAELAEAVLDSETNKYTYTPLKDAITTSATHITFSPSTYEWAEGSEHLISLRVTSGSDIPSADWSNPVRLAIAEKPVVTISGIYGEDDPIHDKTWRIVGEDSEEEEENEVRLSLTKMPFTLTVNGAGSGGKTTAIVTRSDNFDLPRPDDSNDVGYEGETIFAVTNQNEEDSTSFRIEIDDPNLIGHFDDKAPYTLNVSVTDSFGQTTSADPINFWVYWDDQAVMPTAEVHIDKDQEIATIKPIKPQGYTEGAYCQIFRLSADRPQLIVTKAEFEETYVDPYPTYGLSSGYRVVYYTKYGDYRDEQGHLTWVDYEPEAEDELYDIDYLDRFAIVIDFDDDQVVLPANVSLSNSWKKAFQVTRYLGGSIEGDWKEGIERTGSYKAVIPLENDDDDMAYNLRLLADYPGACHIRTPDGSNFYGNVDVSEDRAEKWVRRLASVSLSVTKVDSVSDDGMRYNDWKEEQEEQEE